MSTTPPAAAGPIPQRRHGLVFQDEDAVIADIQRLRRGYTRTAAWSLPQVCWHLDVALKYRMKPGPFPPETPEQAAARAANLSNMLATNTVPSGIKAPDEMTPPADTPDAAIDTCIDTLRRFKAFPGPIAPHRLFGQIPDPEARRLAVIHCAHHLSYLVPTSS